MTSEPLPHCPEGSRLAMDDDSIPGLPGGLPVVVAFTFADAILILRAGDFKAFAGGGVDAVVLAADSQNHEQGQAGDE